MTDRTIITKQGADYRLRFTWCENGPEVDGVITAGDPIDLTGCEAKMQIRAKKDSLSQLLATATSADGDILLGDALGTVEIHIPGDKMDGVNLTLCAYDLKIYFPSGDEARILEGKVVNSLAVTVDT